ncbi:MAG TPA: TSUP family transporter, partial [Acidimicrobiales bacterium]
RPGLAWALPGLLPGTALAGLALATFGDDALAILSGVAILVGVSLSAIGRRPPRGRATFFGAGILSGFMGTTAAVSGPPLALVWQDAPASTIRGTLPPIFLAASTLTLGTLALTGHLPASDWAIGAAMAPGGILGFLLARQFDRRLDRRGSGRDLRWAILAFSAASAVVAIVRVAL